MNTNEQQTIVRTIVKLQSERERYVRLVADGHDCFTAVETCDRLMWLAAKRLAGARTTDQLTHE